ncbi:hypothetical protein BTA51_28570 [Hahella sp. CCB-MM4]|uniref:hypothetical protein n=1 Tax=Hahella sp. (strain CCB-MM4) TaxID=1926491 RepID=UPI000B9BD5D4|nr:hypothetical protein [Hahella sp. CCB-MM4]OZG69937.1 hypothetical protein BTA51_28570 [Hahella sp. CCB-MM4]
MEEKELLLNDIVQIDLSSYAKCFDQINTEGWKYFLFHYDCKETFVCVCRIDAIDSVSHFLAGAHKIFLSKYEMHGEKTKEVASVFEGDMNESIAKARLMDPGIVEKRLIYCIGDKNLSYLHIDMSSEYVKEAIFYGSNDDQFLFVLNGELYYVDYYPG